MKIKMKTSLAGVSGAWVTGQVVSVPLEMSKETAESLLKNNLAEELGDNEDSGSSDEELKKANAKILELEVLLEEQKEKTSDVVESAPPPAELQENYQKDFEALDYKGRLALAKEWGLVFAKNPTKDELLNALVEEATKRDGEASKID